MLYEFHNRLGETIELEYEVGQCPKSIEVDGEIYMPGSAGIRLASGNKSVPHKPKGWPMTSEAAAVFAEDAEAAEAADRAVGVPTEYVDGEDGIAKPQFRDRGHRAKWLRAHGWVDKDGGYRETY